MTCPTILTCPTGVCAESIILNNLPDDLSVHDDLPDDLPAHDDLPDDLSAESILLNHLPMTCPITCPMNHITIQSSRIVSQVVSIGKLSHSCFES